MSESGKHDNQEKMVTSIVVAEQERNDEPIPNAGDNDQPIPYAGDQYENDEYQGFLD